ncbi:hypothetical protein L1277_001121 [Okibacterium sp. HSC-33S16]|uniref:hypothetical protein n=1 Tax=Okibacterium sp. HSC-33S16 TaxID=2910965 RepID=UPI0020A03ACA|nr:hypothetical protein [Okibacterium sp. HSC-33S16]MCP2031030.1 hypothetical protein [Okibacterium sp. HSC-33S16]
MSDADTTGPTDDTSVADQNPATDGLTSEGGVWGVGDPKDEDVLAKETVANDAVAGEPVEQDAAFLDVDEADVETSLSGDSMDSENDQHLFSNTHGEVEPGSDNQDTTTSQLTDAMDSDALASSEAPATDTTGSES